MTEKVVNPGLTLPLWGKAQLLKDGKPLQVRRKALALLYYLALEGPSTRDKLAQLLWERTTSARNLRVELSYLRQLLAGAGSGGLVERSDPLELPPDIRTVVEKQSSAAALPLEDLDDVSAEFQVWVEWMRHQLTEATPSGLGAYTVQIATRIRPPFVLFVQPQLGSNVSVFARELATALQLKYRENLETESALYCPPMPYPADLAERITPNKRSVYVLEMPIFGEIPAPILALRACYPVQQTQFLKLPALTWGTASSGVLQGLPFLLAAEMYLCAEGNPGYLKELRDFEVGRDSSGRLPVPQHIRSLLQFNLTLLTPDARSTLERTTIHPGPISESLLLRFNGAQALEELERHGWLVFNSQSSMWTVRSELVRQVVYQTLHAGRRRSYHQQAADYFSSVGDVMAATYHHYKTCVSLDEIQDFSCIMQVRQQTTRQTWAKLAFEEWMAKRLFDVDTTADEFASLASFEELRKPLPIGTELTLPPMVGSAHVEQDGGRLTVKRRPLDIEVTQISWELPDEPVLIRVKGRGYCDNPLGSGISGNAIPLELRFSRLSSRLILAPVRKPVVGAAREIVLPLASKFDFWCVLPPGGYLSASSAAEVALIELEITAFRLASNGKNGSVEAFDLPAFEECDFKNTVSQAHE